MKLPTLTALVTAKAARRPVAFAVRLDGNAEFVLPNEAASDALNEAGAAALAAGRTGIQLINGGDWFIEAHNPPPRLVIVGAVHIAQALVPLAAMAGLCVILVDPRRAFGNETRFPGTQIINEWPDTALDNIQTDATTAVVTLTHDPKLDDPALDRALRSEAFYIGALGSRNTHAKRLERLRGLGHTQPILNRIRAPVGLAIGALSAPEIALSIIAEIVAVRRNGRLATRPE